MVNVAIVEQPPQAEYQAIVAAPYGGTNGYSYDSYNNRGGYIDNYGGYGEYDKF